MANFNSNIFNTEMAEELNTVTGATASAASNDSQVSGESLQSGSTLVTATGENIASADIQTGEGTVSSTIPVSEADKKGGEGEDGTHKQTKEENAFFKHMRVKAEKEAEAKFNEQMEGFKAKLKKVLPDGYEDVDEFLSNLTADEISDAMDELDNEEETKAGETKPKAEVKSEETTPAGITEEQLDALIAKRLESDPRMKKFFEAEATKQQEEEQSKQDKYIVDSFEEVKTKFEDIKTAEDVPLEVWELWQLGQSGRSLLSCMKEYRYDHDVEKAKNKGAAIAKGQANSVAHTGLVNGGSGGTVQIQEEVEVPIETQAMLKKAGIPKDKWVAYYQKYHR